MADGKAYTGAVAHPATRRGRERIARLVATVAAGALLLASLVHATPASAGDLSPSVPKYNPHFPVFGGGKFVNIFESDAALTNASAHVAWSLAIPLLGQRLGGRKGLWSSGLSWIALTVVQEALFHAPPNPGRGYPSEVRADLLTRIVPCASLLAWDLLRNGRSPAAHPRVVPPDLLRLRVEVLPPDRADQLLRQAALRMPALAGTPAELAPRLGGSLAAAAPPARSIADAGGSLASPPPPASPARSIANATDAAASPSSTSGAPPSGPPTSAGTVVQ